MVLIALVVSILLAVVFKVMKHHRRNLFGKKARQVYSSGNQMDTSEQQHWSAKSIASNTNSEKSQVIPLHQKSDDDAFQSTTDPNSRNHEKRGQIQSILGQENKEAIRGDDLRVDLKLDVREALLGGEKDIRVNYLEICWNCAGSGYLQPNSMRLNLYPECPVCDTQGVTMGRKKLRITVPPGVNSKTRLRVEGEGDAGRHGGESGDLYIYLSVVDNDAEP